MLNRQWRSGFVEGGHAGEDLAFQQLEAGATAGGDVGHLVGQAGLFHSSHGVTAADDRAAALTADVSQGGGDGVGAGGEGVEFEQPMT